MKSTKLALLAVALSVRVAAADTNTVNRACRKSS